MLTPGGRVLSIEHKCPQIRRTSSKLLVFPPNPPIFHFVLKKTEFSPLIFCPPNPPIRLFVLQNVLQFDQKNGCPLVPFLREEKN